MRIIILLIALLLSVNVQAATTITIKEGTTSYGPIGVQQIHKLANFAVDRIFAIDPKITLSATVDYSKNNGTTWDFLCAFATRGTSNLERRKNPLLWNCPIPPNTTHIRAIVTVAGGDWTMPKPPQVTGKP